MKLLLRKIPTSVWASEMISVLGRSEPTISLIWFLAPNLEVVLGISTLT